MEYNGSVFPHLDFYNYGGVYCIVSDDALRIQKCEGGDLPIKIGMSGGSGERSKIGVRLASFSTFNPRFYVLALILARTPTEASLMERNAHEFVRSVLGSDFIKHISGRESELIDGLPLRYLDDIIEDIYKTEEASLTTTEHKPLPLRGYLFFDPDLDDHAFKIIKPTKGMSLLKYEIDYPSLDRNNHQFNSLKRNFLRAKTKEDIEIARKAANDWLNKEYNRPEDPYDISKFTIDRLSQHYQRVVGGGDSDTDSEPPTPPSSGGGPAPPPPPGPAAPSSEFEGFGDFFVDISGGYNVAPEDSPLPKEKPKPKFSPAVARREYNLRSRKTIDTEFLSLL